LTKDPDTFLVGLGIDTNFTIWFDFDSQACNSIRFWFWFDSIQYWLFWISVTI